MALDLLMVAQGGTCAILLDECCVYIPNNSHNMSQALAALGDEITLILALALDPFTSWWNSLGSRWHHVPFGLVCLCLLLSS